jgi:hypothetical protein
MRAPKKAGRALARPLLLTALCYLLTLRHLDIARQLFKLSHGWTISGPTLAKEAQVLLE